MAGSVRELVAEADGLLRAVLHGSLSGCSVPELDGVLVQLVEVAWRVSDLAGRIDAALAHRAEIDRLRLDASGEARFGGPLEAVGLARADLGCAVVAAREVSLRLDNARLVTSTIGFVVDDDGVSAGGGDGS